MQYWTALLSLGLAPALVLAETGPFFSFCGSNSLDFSTLISSCSNGQTSIDLNGGLGNSNGQLVFQKNGGYFGSCAKNGGHCDLQFDVLICECNDDDNNPQQTSISLSSHLVYDTDTNSLSFQGL